jgi:hypothetical protein
MPPTLDTDAARHAAQGILAERRFHQPSVPRPLHGVLEAIGNAVRAPGRLLTHAVNALGRVLPGGAAAVWVALGLALIAAGAVFAGRYSRRALLDGRRGDGAGARVPAQRAADLERAAERAEREGRLTEAVRLRFRAGLGRLAEQGVISAPRSTPTADLSRALASPSFDALASRFDEISYGASPAESRDVEQARDEWPAIVHGVRRR